MGNGLQSMTGFASKQGSWEQFAWSMELRSVNGRGLDLRLRVPDWIDGLESECRKRLQAALKRGNVTLSLRLQKEEQNGSVGRLNEDGLRRALDILKRIEVAAHQAGLTLAASNAADVAATNGVLEWGDEAETNTNALKAEVLDDFDACITEFTANRAREGDALTEIIQGHITKMFDLTVAARRIADTRDESQKSNLNKALSKVLDVSDMPDPDRLLQEMAIIAVKTDVTEELNRLLSHIDAAKALLEDSGAVGRKFDFLMQEFNREANTLCSKSQSTDLTAVGLELKAVIDQLREQVQNVE